MDELKKRIREIIEERGSRSSNVNDLLKKLSLPPTDKRRIRRLLREMALEGEFAKTSRGREFISHSHTTVLTGILRTSTKGFGFVIPEEEFLCGMESRDIFISRRHMGDAMNNDKVRVRITGSTPKQPEGEIIEVVERGTKQIVGIYYATKRGGTVIPRDERFTRSVVTPRPDPSLEIAEGTFVLVEITGWTPSSQPLLGRVVEALGDSDTPGIDITVIIRDAGVEPDFPPKVVEEAEVIPAKIPADETARRTDFRDIPTFTMDGATAKDFDDALSIERLADGGFRLGVHIADVSWYVREGSMLDVEAYERATSIYPIDRVVPMLPEKLSNNVCSLRPNEDRLTMSCIMDIDSSGRVEEYSVHEGIIRSSHRLIYEEVQQAMDGKAEPGVARSLGKIRLELEALYELRLILTKMRLRRGALDLDIPETEVLFHDDGTVKGLARRDRMESHRVVEECMLIANEVVATHLFNLHIPSVYRVHEPPDLNKLRQLQPVLAQLGVRFPARKDITADAIQFALNKAAELETGFIARRLILRAMMRAHYHDENLGHYGLASACYTHFTSPIRRYPDLLVHRLLRETLEANAPSSGVYLPPGEVVPEQGRAAKPVKLRGEPALPPRRVEYYRNHLENWTQHCSERERRADDIERDAARVKALEYMRAFLGEEFEGWITSVTSWGFFVELQTMPIEGLVHVRNLRGDFFEFDEEHLRLVGQETGQVFKLGDRVKISVENVNMAQLQMDFGFVEKFETNDADAERENAKRERLNRAHRHVERKPRHGGFQRRGKKR